MNECPNGCGCVAADDPDRTDCACDGPCCMDPDWPEVEQRRYCATCHAPTGVHVYPAITVEVPPEAGAAQPSAVAFLHYSRCPDHT